MLPTFVLLCLSICAVWLPDVRTANGWRVRPWQPLFIAFLASGLYFGQLTWLATLALAATWACAEASMRLRPNSAATVLTAAALLLALALAVHLLPGFNNPLIAPDLRLGARSPPITQYASMDKGAAGLLLVAYYCRRVEVQTEWPAVVATGIAAGAATSFVVVGLVAALGFIAPDPKWPRFALMWVPINLLLTCVAEEAFFRGVVQERLIQVFEPSTRRRWLPLAVSSVLFGLVHAGGGIALVIGATVAGIGYGAAYGRTRRIEAAVLAHFTLNAVHFFGFTYPYAVR